jgi:serine protease Do
MKLLEELSDSLEELVERASPAVVAVEHGRGQGTGLLLTPDGYVLTNHHVVRGARRPKVRLSNGEEHTGETVGADPSTDLAVVRTEGSGFTTLALAPPERLRVGQLVLAIGHPFHLESSVSLGVVSALHRNLPAPDGSMLEGMIQTDAAINPGNSGGPLLSMRGEVVGINSIVLPHGQGIGFAIPATTASWVAALLIQRGRVERRYLGVGARAERLATSLADELKQRRGVRVLQVAVGSPAERAGLKSGDLLLALGGEAVNSVDDVHRLLALSPTSVLRAGLWRGGKRVELELETVARAA